MHVWGYRVHFHILNRLLFEVFALKALVSKLEMCSDVNFGITLGDECSQLEHSIIVRQRLHSYT
jgi:hypothetical protein